MAGAVAFGEDGPAHAFDASLAHDGVLWTPSIAGPSITLEVAAHGSASFQVRQVAQLFDVDARPFAPRYDVYYGGLTDVEYWVHVTDTITGTTRQYYNAPNTVGGVDRASFAAN